MADWSTIIRWNFPRSANWYGPNKVVVDLWNSGRPYSAVGCDFYALYQVLNDGTRGDTICSDIVDAVDPGEGDEGAVYLVDPDAKPIRDNSTNGGVIDLRSIMQRIRDQQQQRGGEQPKTTVVHLVE